MTHIKSLLIHGDPVLPELSENIIGGILHENLLNITEKKVYAHSLYIYYDYNKYKFYIYYNSIYIKTDYYDITINAYCIDGITVLKRHRLSILENEYGIVINKVKSLLNYLDSIEN